MAWEIHTIHLCMATYIDLPILTKLLHHSHQRLLEQTSGYSNCYSNLISSLQPKQGISNNLSYKIECTLYLSRIHSRVHKYKTFAKLLQNW